MGNPIVHWELMVSDMAKAKAFYSSVFDWEWDESAFPGYPVIKTGADPGGGMMAKPEMALACALNTYFGVEDVESTMAKAVEAGATMTTPQDGDTRHRPLGHVRRPGRDPYRPLPDGVDAWAIRTSAYPATSKR